LLDSGNGLGFAFVGSAGFAFSSAAGIFVSGFGLASSFFDSTAALAAAMAAALRETLSTRP
jgi:hypothetical protein